MSFLSIAIDVVHQNSIEEEMCKYSITPRTLQYKEFEDNIDNPTFIEKYSYLGSFSKSFWIKCAFCPCAEEY